MKIKEWSKLLCKSKELQLKGTLDGGQSFRWKTIKNEQENSEEWIGVFADRVWKLKQENDCLLYQVYQTNDVETDDYETLLKNYFRLDLNLEKHYIQWSEADPLFKQAAKQFYGIRILAQEPVENVFSFICSTNNHISRISGMVEKLCSHYGEKICELNGKEYYSFPKVESLTGDGVEKKLKTLGFGYRSAYITKTAKMITEMGGKEWFENLKQMDYTNAKSNLKKLSGIGSKVADCICLMSLGHLESIPVDTHVYQIAARNYLTHLGKRKTKTVTEKIYKDIGEHFRELYGPLAGWAHTVLFCADLKKFQTSEESTSEPASKRKKK